MTLENGIKEQYGSGFRLIHPDLDKWQKEYKDKYSDTYNRAHQKIYIKHNIPIELYKFQVNRAEINYSIQEVESI